MRASKGLSLVTSRPLTVLNPYFLPSNPGCHSDCLTGRKYLPIVNTIIRSSQSPEETTKRWQLRLDLLGNFAEHSSPSKLSMRNCVLNHLTAELIILPECLRPVGSTTSNLQVVNSSSHSFSPLTPFSTSDTGTSMPNYRRGRNLYRGMLSPPPPFHLHHRHNHSVPTAPNHPQLTPSPSTQRSKTPMGAITAPRLISCIVPSSQIASAATKKPGRVLLTQAWVLI